MVTWPDKQHYGLLGAEFTPNPSGFMDCIIPVSEDQGEFASSIAAKYDRVSWLFPEEVAEAARKVILATSCLP
jgi:hypothetical protein